MNNLKYEEGEVKVQLTFKQHGSEMCMSTYMKFFFFNKYFYSTTQSVVG